MEKAGIEKMNKKRRDNKGYIIDSIFASNWRDFINVKS